MLIWEENVTCFQMIAHKILIKIGVVYVLWESGNTVETVCLLSNRKPDTKVRIDVDLEDYYRIKDSKKNQN